MSHPENLPYKSAHDYTTAGATINLVTDTTNGPGGIARRILVGTAGTVVLLYANGKTGTHVIGATDLATSWAVLEAHEVNSIMAATTNGLRIRVSW